MVVMLIRFYTDHHLIIIICECLCALLMYISMHINVINLIDPKSFECILSEPGGSVIMSGASCCIVYMLGLIREFCLDKKTYFPTLPIQARNQRQVGKQQNFLIRMATTSWIWNWICH